MIQEPFRLLALILPFTPIVLMVCPDPLRLTWVAGQAEWVVVIEPDAEIAAKHNGMGLRNVDVYCGPLNKFEESDEAWDWRLNFDLVIAEGVMGDDPEGASKLLRSWARWVLIFEPAGIDYRPLFGRIVVCHDGAEEFMLLGK